MFIWLCPYCIEFDNTGIFETLKDEFDDMKFLKLMVQKTKIFVKNIIFKVFLN